MTERDGDGTPPILRDRFHDSVSEFTPESLLREARRQKDLKEASVPEVRVLIRTVTSFAICRQPAGP